MNPPGIRAFYGAWDLETCVAELRPRVGEYVIFGEFVIHSTLKLIDFRNLPALELPESLFEEVEGARYDTIRFLRSFEKSISLPITPRQEPIEYLGIQAFCEFLHFEKDIDGIVYGSSQCPGKYNIVLFGNAGEEIREIEAGHAFLGLFFRDQPTNELESLFDNVVFYSHI